MKYDNSLTEVWGWKEQCYQELKDLTAKERIARRKEATDKLLSEAGVKLRNLHLQDRKM